MEPVPLIQRLNSVNISGPTPWWIRLECLHASSRCCWSSTGAFGASTWSRSSASARRSDKARVQTICWRANRCRWSKTNSQHSIRCTRSVFHSAHPFHCLWCSSFLTPCKCCSPSAQRVSSAQFLFLIPETKIVFAITFIIILTFIADFNFAFAVIATVALAFLLLPMCQYIIRPCFDGSRMSFGFCGRFNAAELFSFTLAVSIVCVWVLTGHWLLMDGMDICGECLILWLTHSLIAAMGMGLCVAFIAFVRLPSLKVSTLLLTGLLLYDVFWVFFSSYIFSANVMVKVATRPAENPVGLVARKLNLGAYVREAPKLNLPGKLVFPSIHNSGHFSMLGLGDIVMPGLLLCFVLRYDAYKKSQGTLADVGVPVPKGMGSRLTYFHCSLLGWVAALQPALAALHLPLFPVCRYFLGLLTATVSSEIFKAAQPALLYLVPFTLLPLLTMAYLKVRHFRWPPISANRSTVWRRSFHSLCREIYGACGVNHSSFNKRRNS